MPNRTIKLLGHGFGSTDAEITVTLEGTTIYTGPVTTVDQSVPDLPNLELLSDQVELCSFELPIDFSGQKSMTCTVTNGTVIFADIKANYCKIINPVFTSSDLEILSSPTSTPQEKYNVRASHAVPPFTAEEESYLLAHGADAGGLVILNAHGVATIISSGSTVFYEIDADDARSNITIDGVEKSPVHAGDYAGTFWWVIPNGSVLAYDLDVDAGLE